MKYKELDELSYGKISDLLLHKDWSELSKEWRLCILNLENQSYCDIDRKWFLRGLEL